MRIWGRLQKESRATGIFCQVPCNKPPVPTCFCLMYFVEEDQDQDWEQGMPLGLLQLSTTLCVSSSHVLGCAASPLCSPHHEGVSTLHSMSCILHPASLMLCPASQIPCGTHRREEQEPSSVAGEDGAASSGCSQLILGHAAFASRAVNKHLSVCLAWVNPWPPSLPPRLEEIWETKSLPRLPVPLLGAGKKTRQSWGGGKVCQKLNCKVERQFQLSQVSWISYLGK